jgi:hypothetical protein
MRSTNKRLTKHARPARWFTVPDADYLDHAIHKAVIKRNNERYSNLWGNQQGVA